MFDGVNNKTEKSLAEVEKLVFREEDFKAEIFRTKNALCVRAPTWDFNPQKTIESFLDDFSRDYFKAAADFGANPKAHVRRYFTVPEFLERAATKRPHPIQEDGTFAYWFNGGSKSYALGMDLSNLKKDNAGFCLAHQENGKYYIDLFHVLIGGRGENLIFDEVKNFIRQLQSRNFHIMQAATDSWQSLALMQDLAKMGIYTETNSLDRNSQIPDTVQGLFLSGKVDYYPFPLFIKEAKSLIKTKNGKVDHPSSGCFTGDTRVALLDGTNPTFKELCEKYKNGEEFYVWSMSEKGIVPGRARNPRLTKKSVPILEIVLDNFQTVRCTPDHLFMMRDGTYRQAKDLRSGDSLMPFYRKVCAKKGLSGYIMLYDPIKRKNLMAHHIVGEFKYNRTNWFKDGLVLHHVNHEKFDNTPENLKLMSRAEHASHHTKEKHASDLEYHKKVVSAVSKYARSETGRNTSKIKCRNMIKYMKSDKGREGARKIGIASIPRLKEYAKSERGRKISKSTAEKYLVTFMRTEKGRNLASKHAIRMWKEGKWKARVFTEEEKKEISLRMKKLWASGKFRPVFTEESRKKISEKSKETWEKRKKNKLLNHKILTIKDGGVEDVYDLTVDTYHNFALSSEIFVHNSKDIWDSACQAINLLYKNPQSDLIFANLV